MTLHLYNLFNRRKTECGKAASPTTAWDASAMSNCRPCLEERRAVLQLQLQKTEEKLKGLGA